MIFRSLSMAGFKSFAEKAELEIETGLTGIVGPNGCGKSNIVEGLRFVMGESSARQMRGAELDDIIFSGTESRPSRNLAEITLQLDNSQKTAPAEYNSFDELEISRKVERGKGSNFQINGRPARARDIQLLFADSATGARSAGMVSQGRIGAIVGAKPEDRRSLIEEAANIKGLHQRRHEAELRLRGTETNLERLEDITAQLAEQRNQLAKQARQAARYRSVADRIRKAEARLALSRWQRLRAEGEQAAAELKEHQQLVEKATAAAAAAAAAQADRAAALPALRQAEAEQAALVQTLRIELAECDREADRLSAAIARLDAQIEQINSDAQRERGLQDDAQKAIAALEAEAASITVALADNTPQLEQARQHREQTAAASQEAERAAVEARTSLASARQTKEQLQKRKAELEKRIENAAQSLSQLNLKTLSAREQDAQEAVQNAEHQLATMSADLAKTEDILAQRTAERDTAARARTETEAAHTRLTAEIDALSYLLAESQLDDGTAVADALSVSGDMELALTAALGADLNLPAGTGHNGFWRTDWTGSDALTAPQTGQPLSQFVTGAASLKRALAGVSVIGDDIDALAAQKQLKPGQSLVSRNGRLWRWDGLVRTSQPNSDAERIKQRQRLAALSTQEAGIKKQLDERKSAFEAAEQQQRDAAEQLRALSVSSREAGQTAEQARRASDSATMALKTARTRESDLTSALETAKADLEAVARESWLDADLDTLSAQADMLAEKAGAARTRFDDALRKETEISQSVQTGQQRAQTISSQINDWQSRREQTGSRQEEIARRAAQAAAERQTLDNRPAELEQHKHKLAENLEAQETLREEKSDNLRHAEAGLSEADQNMRECERSLAHLRESLIRSESLAERLASETDSFKERVAEKLNCTPDELASVAQLEAGTAFNEPVEKLEAAVNRLMNERDQIGPVNLRAEVEMAELDERVKQLQAEHDDLTEAIARLRAAIATLNREGRARLMDSFAAVNTHFERLFKTLFGGGHAELQLTGSDDPLEAGLDILASPPGKRLQSLSLLSGGEQALTALAIIFAVFLTNPAPICVLDEVDAPLDDSNVARFCDLLRDIAERTQTRFLVVTHHRMTMARMDRLYGVTMEQKGVSRLVSVDLQTAEGLRDSLIA